MKNTKKSLHNILAIVNLSMLGIWVAVLAAARITESDPLSIAFVWVTLAAIIVPVIYTVVSIVSLIKKKPLSKKLLAATYAVNFVWLVVVIYVIKTITVMGSPLF